MPGSRAGLSLLLLLQAAGCAIRIPIAKYNVPPPQPGHSRAGAKKVDITPPPGYPMGGHSIGGRVARGYWTRLYARAFYFEDAEGHTLALVSCDLFAIPAGLHAKVSRLVAGTHRIPLAPESIVLAATHTHHGPAGYMSSPVFNMAGPVPGFDARLLEELAGRIAHAIRLAREDALASGGGFTVAMHHGYAVNLQRNRAIDAFFRDPRAEVDAVLKESRAAGMTCPDPQDSECPRYQAADPALGVLEVIRGGRRIGLLVFFAIHATAMSHDNPLYQSDLTGRAMDLLERDEPIVAGFFNGAEGDISPRWVSQDRGDVLALGKQLADAVKSVVARAAAPEANPSIEASSRTYSAYPAEKLTKTLTAPQSGVAELGGAEDGRTLLYAYGWRGGVTRTGADPKLPALHLNDIALLKLLQKIVGAPKNYPGRIPVTVASAGASLSLAAVPAEMTALQGRRLRQSLEAATGRRFTLVGLANEYIGYTATREEYAAQNYEGAATVYGPDQGKVIGELLLDTARRPSVPSAMVPAVTFNAGGKPLRQFGPELVGARRHVSYEDLELLMPDRQHRVDDRSPRFEWKETEAGDWQTGDRRVAILRRDGAGWKLVDDDRGVDLLTVLRDAGSSRHARQWTAVWLPPQPFDLDSRYIFRVKPADAADTICSEEFSLSRRVTEVPAPVKARAASCPTGVLP